MSHRVEGYCDLQRACNARAGAGDRQVHCVDVVPRVADGSYLAWDCLRDILSCCCCLRRWPAILHEQAFFASGFRHHRIRRCARASPPLVRVLVR